MERLKHYQSPDLLVTHLAVCNGFLVGSVTDVKLQPASVTVQQYEDGFSAEGGFKDLDFDK